MLPAVSDPGERVAAELPEFDFERKRLALEALGVQATVYRLGHTPRYVITADIPMVDLATLATPPSYMMHSRTSTPAGWW
jgi:hypothetical protein